MAIAPLASTPLPTATAQSGATGAGATASAAGAADALEAPGPLQVLLAGTTQSAATIQNGLANLMANASRALAAGTLPPAVQSAVQQLLALHLPTDRLPDAAAIRNALASSGLFTEAMLAAGQAPADLKTALTQLNDAAERPLAGSRNPPPTETAAPSVPPPVRGGPPSAQSPAAPSLPVDASPELAAKLLAQGSEAALARQTLLQMASLPDPGKPEETRWIFDLPLMTPQGAAVAQLVVERDGHDDGEAAEPVWRVGLAIDIAPLGPVRAQLALSRSHAWVSISADRPETLQKLQQNSAWLGDALAAADLEADIAFQSGPVPAAPSGRLVDHAS